ncbi:hypothetical protein K1719_030263 [Acacia pycnantha]|nr:hypothetical protein K1719_030263 [Acacia pycnantha]
MKAHALLAFFFFSSAAFFAFTTAEIVYDSDGDILNNGFNYYLLSPGYGGQAIVGSGIGNGDGSCSLAVVQKLLYKKGWLTNIASPLLTVHISTTYPLWISFAHLPIPCTTNPNWLVTRDTTEGVGEDSVMVGNNKEFPNPLSGWFYIKAYDSSKFHYKLVFCSEKCGHVGAKTDSHGNKRLIVTEDEKVEPLVFKFVKETSDISMVV